MSLFEKNRKMAKEKFLETCFANLMGDVPLEQVQLDSKNIKPDSIRPKEIASLNEDGGANFKGVVEVTLDPSELAKELIREAANIRRLRNLLTIERSARSDLVRIKEQFANDPLLLGIYSSSVQYALDQATEAIDEVFGDLLGVDE